MRRIKGDLIKESNNQSFIQKGNLADNDVNLKMAAQVS